MRYLLVVFLLLLKITLWAQSIVLFEEFNDNKNDWPIAQQSDVTTSVKNGKYYVNRLNKNGASLLSNAQIKIDENEDFVFEIKAGQISGNANYGYGFYWGGADPTNFYAITISQNKTFSYYKFEEGRFFDLSTKYNLDDFIKDKGAQNTVKMVKKEERISVFINEVIVFSGDFQSFFGQEAGLLVNSEMKVAFDHVKIIQGNVPDTYTINTPNIEWMTPEKKFSEVSENFVFLEAGIKSASELRVVQLYHNHELIKEIEQFKGYRSASMEYDEIINFRAELMVGINEFKLVAENIYGERSVSTRIIKLKDFERMVRHDYALVIATNEYDEWDDLVNPVFDANTIAEELRLSYGFDTEVITDVSTNEIMAKLKEYATKNYEKFDQLFIFFAGHGKYDKFFGEGYVVCKNSKEEDEGNTTMLSHSTLRTVINNIPCEHIFLAMDVCFGGTFDPKLGTSGHRGGSPIYEELTREQFVKHKLKYKTRKYLTSGGNEYVPDGTPGQHSPFARKIIEALRVGRGEDDVLTLNELIHFLEKVQPEPRFGEFGSNEPGSDFLFVRKY